MRVSEKKAAELLELLKSTWDWTAFIRRVSDEAFRLGRYGPLPRVLFTDAIAAGLVDVMVEKQGGSRMWQYKVDQGESEEIESDGKCGGCNWEVTMQYVLAPTKEKADQTFKDQENCGLCGDCMSEMLCENDFVILESKGA
jgi:hypothetical protein